MLPQSITTLLARLRRRERLLALAWSAAKWFAVLAAAVVVCCAIDNFVDYYRDTPSWLRWTMTGTMFLLVALAVVFPSLAIARRRLPDEEMALWVEESKPHFRHRLISAVQFHGDGAKTEGMSVEL